MPEAESETSRQEDRRLARGLKAGRRRAWDRFCTIYAAPLYRFTAARCEACISAEDLAQDALAEAVEHISRFDANQGALWTWLCGIAMNIIRETRRRHARDDRLQGNLALAAPQTPEKAPGDSRDVHLVLSRLHPRHQEVLILKYLEGLAQRDLAERLGLSEKAVESRLTRAREAFRKTCEERDAQEREESSHD